MKEQQGKVCAKCKQWKPLEEYYKDKTKKDGRESRCKGCKSEDEKQRRSKKHPKKIKEVREGKKKCTQCGVWKPLEEYYKDKRNKDGRQSKCRECQKECNKQWRENNPEYQKQWKENNPEYQKQWKENNPEYFKIYFNSEQQKQYREVNKEKRKEYDKQYREVNKEKRKEYNKQWRKDNAEYFKQYRKDNEEHIKGYEKQWRKDNAEHIKERKKQYRKDNAGHIKEYNKQYHKQHYKDNIENNLQYISSIVDQIRPIFKELSLPVYGYIYKFENIKTGHVYIGQTTYPLKMRYGFEGGIIKSWIKERREKVTQKFIEELIEEEFEVKELFDVACCKYHLDKLEAYWINKYDSCNNGYNNNTGYHDTDDGLEEFIEILEQHNLEFIDGQIVKNQERK